MTGEKSTKTEKKKNASTIGMVLEAAFRRYLFFKKRSPDDNFTLDFPKEVKKGLKKGALVAPWLLHSAWRRSGGNWVALQRWLGGAMPVAGGWQTGGSPVAGQCQAGGWLPVAVLRCAGCREVAATQTSGRLAAGWWRTKIQ